MRAAPFPPCRRLCSGSAGTMGAARLAHHGALTVDGGRPSPRRAVPSCCFGRHCRAGWKSASRPCKHACGLPSPSQAIKSAVSPGLLFSPPARRQAREQRQSAAAGLLATLQEWSARAAKSRVAPIDASVEPPDGPGSLPHCSSGAVRARLLLLPLTISLPTQHHCSLFGAPQRSTTPPSYCRLVQKPPTRAATPPCPMLGAFRESGVQQ